MTHLKKTDASGRTLLLFRVSQMPKKYDSVNTMKYAFIHFDVTLLENDRFCISGVTVIVDCKGISSDHVFNTNPAALKKAITCQMVRKNINYKIISVKLMPYCLF